MANAEAATAANVADAAGAAERRIAAIFRSWDASGDGRIGVEDLRDVLLRLGVPAAHVQVIFESADANKDGCIDYNEFLTWICGSGAHAPNVRNRLEHSYVLSAVGVEGAAAPQRAVGGISDQELSQLRAETRYMSKPNPILKRTFEAMYLILNVGTTPSPSRPPQWSQVQKMTQDLALGDRLRNFELETLRAAPDLIAYLVQHYFGPGGAQPPGRLANGAETLTYHRVRRASKSAALIFHWSCRELIDVGALLPPPEEEAPGPDSEDLERQEQLQRNRQTPTLSGALASLPSRNDLVEPHQVLLQLMTGAAAEASSLAESFKSQGPCDRCDGAHHALDCPHFGPHKGHKAWTPRSRGREDHQDAWANLDAERASEDRAPAEFVVRGRQVQQPGDGTCLYHSMAFGLRRAGLLDAGFTGHDLRREIADWCEANADEVVSSSSFRDYIWWDHQMTVEDYCKRMRDGGTMVWGGAIEIAACTRMHHVNVHVYVPESGASGNFRRIASFGDDDTVPTLAVTYMLRCHYDALEIS